MSSQPKTDSWIKLLIIFVIILTIWAAGGYFTYNSFCTWSDRGTFGDMFGGINALFAGLAFAGLIYTIYLQRDELRLQREELKLTRIELSRAATAQEQSENRLSEQVTAMNTSVKAKSLIFLIEYLQDIEKVEARRIVIQDLSKKDLSEWTNKDKKAASSVCSSYDITAIFIRDNLVPEEIFLDDYSPSIKMCFDVCKPYIDHLRKNAGPKYWNDIEWLYNKIISRE